MFDSAQQKEAQQKESVLCFHFRNRSDTELHQFESQLEQFVLDDR